MIRPNLSALLLALPAAPYLPAPLLAQEPTAEGASALGLPELEARHWTVDYLTPPAGEVLEVGGMGFLSDGRLVVSTRRGQVWLVDQPLAEDPADARFTLFAEGLWEGLGLAVVHDEIFVVQRTELSRLVDTDGDDRCDRIDTVCDDWGVSGNYHEFAFGLPVDDEGNFYVSLNVSFFSPKWWHGKSPVPYRGWILKISPEGEMTPVAMGVRSPCGLGLNPEGDLFYTDNQGDWMPVCPIAHVRPGDFFGHPASLDWTEEYLDTKTKAGDMIPPTRERAPAAIWIPYEWSRSTGNLVADETGGAFGPFEGQMIVGEVTNGMVLRAMLEKVRGEYQGAIVPLRHQVGSTARVAFAPDGTLICGLTNRGWGGLSPADGLARVRFTGVTPQEVEGVHLVQDGFDVRLTLPLAADAEPAARAFHHDYDYWWEYGSPERHREDLAVGSVEVSADRRTLRLRGMPLVAGRVARVTLDGVVAEGGLPLLHDEFAYTINQLPEGPRSAEHVAKTVPPPPARASEREGWLRLTWGDATDLWTGEGWELVDAELDRDDPTRLATTPGVGALCNTAASEPEDFVSGVELGDARVTLAYMLPAGGSAALYLQGRYGLLLSESSRGGPMSGTLLGGEGYDGRAPVREVHGVPGQWHELDLVFRAPRFDGSGRKTEDARIERVSIDGVQVQGRFDFGGPSEGGLPGEVPAGPLRFEASRGPVALGNVQAQPPKSVGPGGTFVDPLADGLEGWTLDGDPASFEYDDGTLYGAGPRCHAFTPRGDHRDVEVMARVKLGEGARSALFLRSRPGDPRPSGYEVVLNATFADEERTGSVSGLAPRTVQLVGPDTWFDLRARCETVDGGVRVRVWVNGVLVNEVLDPEGRFASGHVALQQHHEGGLVEIEELRVREL
jgi:glucose/arabinose dehydrogenase